MDELLLEETIDEETFSDEEIPCIIRGIRRLDDAAVVEVEGEVDLSTSPQLRDALAGMLGSGRAVVVDLSRVSYMDSSGFGILLTATKRMRPFGGSMHIVGANPSIERMLLITRLNTMFSLHESEAAALAVLRPRPNGVG